MAAPRLDILAIGNAVVDVIATADDAFLQEHGLEKGSMCRIDAEAAISLYGHMGPAREISGGSAANTLAGVAALGRSAGFVGQIADDQLGEVFRHDLIAQGVEFRTASLSGGQPTGRCLILVTPDGQRTMRTFLGASEILLPSALDRAQIEDAAILYLEGYMWGPCRNEAMVEAIAIARRAGRKVAFTLSDPFCIDLYRADFTRLLRDGHIDILFANEAEIQSLYQTDSFEKAAGAAAAHVPIVVVTRGHRGAVGIAQGQRHAVDAVWVDRVLDTTGAGDLFAAGFLAGHAAGRPVSQCLEMGAVAACEVICHYGARTEGDLAARIAAHFNVASGDQNQLVLGFG